MDFAALSDYIRDISLTVNNGNVKYFQGRLEAITLTDYSDKVYIYVLPFEFSGQFDNSIIVQRSVSVSMFVFKQDELGSEVNQNDEGVLQQEMTILSETKKIAEEIIYKFNQNTISDELERASDQVAINSYTLSPAIKNTSLQLTGYTLDFQVSALDTFDYCSV